MQKKMSAEKFYSLYYQLTELIPLFSYLERFNVMKYTIMDSKSFETPDGSQVPRQSIMKLTKNRKSNVKGEEEKEGQIKVEIVKQH